MFFQTILSFVLSRKIIKIYNDIVQTHGNSRIKDFRKYEKLKYKLKKPKLDINFWNNYKQINVYPKFLNFKLPNVSNKDVLSICKRLLHSAFNKRNKEPQHVSKELSRSETFLFKQLSIIDFCILNRFITSHNKKLIQKSLNTQQKKISSLTRNCSLSAFTSNEIITNLTQGGLYFSIQPDKTLKSEIFTTFEKINRSFINNLKSEETKNQINAHLSYITILISTTKNLLHVHYVDITSYETLGKIKTSL